MKNLLVLAVTYLLLVACVGEQAPNDIVEIPDTELTGNRGQVLSVIQVAGYTYIEVRTNGRSLWLAGNPVEVAEGDVISWGQSATMSNFESRALNRTFDELVFVSAVYLGTAGAPPVTQVGPDRDSGIVRSTEDAGGYSYIEVETDAEQILWLAAPLTELAAGDRIKWQGASKMLNFNSTSLDRTFPEILFVAGISIDK